jgi:hypothetical protein
MAVTVEIKTGSRATDPSFLAAFLLGGLFLSVLTMSSSEQGFS